MACRIMLAFRDPHTFVFGTWVGAHRPDLHWRWSDADSEISASDQVWADTIWSGRNYRCGLAEADHEPIPIRAFSCQRGSTVQADWRIEDNADAVKAFLCTKYPCQAGAFWEKSSESCRTCPFNGTSVRGQILGVGSCSCPSGRVFLYAVPPVPDRRCRHCGQRRGFSVSLPRMLVPCRVRHVLQPGRGRSEFGFSVFHRRDAAEYWMWARLGGASGMKPLRKPRVKQRQRRVPLSAGSWLPC